MPAEEIAFRVAFDGPLTELTRAHPEATLSLWCDWKREILEIAGASEAEVKPLVAKLTERTPTTEAFALDDRTQVIVTNCIDLPHDFVNQAVDTHACLNLPPTRFESGWESYTVLSFSEQKSRAMFKAIRDSGRKVELLTKRKLSPQPLLNTRGLAPSQLFAGLTDKQAEALWLGHRHGLYGSPRRTTAASIAEAVGLSRSTYEEHLRKAENKVVANIVPHLELFMKGRKAQRETEPTS